VPGRNRCRANDAALHRFPTAGPRCEACRGPGDASPSAWLVERRTPARGSQSLLARTAVCIGRLHTASHHSTVSTPRLGSASTVTAIRIDVARSRSKPCGARRHDHVKRCAGEYHRVGMGAHAFGQGRDAGAAFYRRAGRGPRRADFARWGADTRFAEQMGGIDNS
jgi:hypothetical protein